jgi:hypothetical protein
MSPLCHNRDRPLQALDHGAMVEMDVSHKDGIYRGGLFCSASTPLFPLSTSSAASGFARDDPPAARLEKLERLPTNQRSGIAAAGPLQAKNDQREWPAERQHEGCKIRKLWLVSKRSAIAPMTSGIRIE